MRGIEQDQPPFYYHSETELELLIGEKLAVAVLQNIIADQSCRVNLPSVQESKKDRCFS